MNYFKILTGCLVILALVGATWTLAAEKTAQPAPPTVVSASQASPGETSDDDTFDDEEFNDEPLVQVPDPLRPFNLAMHHFNDTLYYALLRPVASVYRALVPPPVRRCVKNFFDNITGPRRMISCLIQGKNQQAEAEFVRFIMNSTVGVLGLGDPAGKFDHLTPPKEDLGQTLGAYGIGEGFYLVLPFLGPYTLRDTVGWVGDGFLHPFAYIDPAEAVAALWAFEKTNEISYRIGDYEAIKEAAIEPYEAFRDAYIQYRRKQVQE